MADDTGNGTTLTFDSAAVGKITDISFSKDGNPIDVTNLGSTVQEFLNGTPAIECTITVVGVSSLAVDDSGTLAIAWNDGSSDNGDGATFIITKREPSTGTNSRIETAVTFQPTPTVA